MVYKGENTLDILSLLVHQGWIPLVQMTTLLGYSSPTVIYQRQHTKNRIETIRVGGVNRVDEQTAIEAIEASKNTTHTEAILRVYRRTKNNV